MKGSSFFLFQANVEFNSTEFNGTIKFQPTFTMLAIIVDMSILLLFTSEKIFEISIVAVRVVCIYILQYTHVAIAYICSESIFTINITRFF